MTRAYACAGCALNLDAPRPRCPRCSGIGSIMPNAAWSARGGGRMLRAIREDEETEDGDDEDEYDPENSAPVLLSEIETSAVERMHTNIRPLDRALRGGFVYGCVYVIVGGPGSGKSRLVMQIIRESNIELAYYMGVEETGDKIRTHAQDMDVPAERVRCWPKKATHLEAAFDIDFEPNLVVVDSLQAMPVRGIVDRNERLVEVMRTSTKFAQETQSVVLVISRINQMGTASGTKDIEHDGDGTIYMELAGVDDDDPRRRIRIVKHRHGRAPITLFADMADDGLQFEDETRESRSKKTQGAATAKRNATPKSRKKMPSRVKLASARRR